MSDYFDRIERQLVRGVEASAGRRFGPRIRLDYLAPAAAILVVLVTGAVFLGLRSHGSPASSAAAGAGQLVFTASGLGGQPPATAAVDRSVAILRRRMDALVPGAHVVRVGGDVVVTLKHPSSAARARASALTVPGRLAVYDWENDVLSPNGRTVASQLRRPAAAALTISQGNGTAAPGSPDAGSVSSRQARTLASEGRSHYRVGTVLLRAEGVGVPQHAARFYVLLNRVALSGRALVDPQQSKDQGGSPAVTFGFTSAGQRAFRNVTSAVAHRGAIVSGPGQMLNQHFAIAVDGQLISVPSIDSRQYPNGITGNGRADIIGGFTVQSARELATVLRFGPLPVRLTAR